MGVGVSGHYIVLEFVEDDMIGLGKERIMGLP